MKVYLINADEFRYGRMILKLVDLPMESSELEEALNEIGGAEQKFILTDFATGSSIRCMQYKEVFALNELVAEQIPLSRA